MRHAFSTSGRRACIRTYPNSLGKHPGSGSLLLATHAGMQLLSSHILFAYAGATVRGFSNSLDLRAAGQFCFPLKHVLLLCMLILQGALGIFVFPAELCLALIITPPRFAFGFFIRPSQTLQLGMLMRFQLILFSKELADIIMTCSLCSSKFCTPLNFRIAGGAALLRLRPITGTLLGIYRRTI